MPDATFRKIFTTPYDEHADRHGQAFEHVRTITESDEDHDAECLPVYRVRFVVDGFEIDAWPEEVVVGEYGTLVSSVERHEDALRHDANYFQWKPALDILESGAVGIG